MNYFEIYENLILKRKNSEVLKKGFEVHHILPRSLGGKDNDENLVRLTPREHSVAHSLLYMAIKEQGFSNRLVIAARWLGIMHYHHSRTYEQKILLCRKTGNMRKTAMTKKYSVLWEEL